VFLNLILQSLDYQLVIKVTELLIIRRKKNCFLKIIVLTLQLKVFLTSPQNILTLVIYFPIPFPPIRYLQYKSFYIEIILFA